MVHSLIAGNLQFLVAAHECAIAASMTPRSWPEPCHKHVRSIGQISVSLKNRHARVYLGIDGNSVSASGENSGLLMMPSCMGTMTFLNSTRVILSRSQLPAARAGKVVAAVAKA